MCQQLRLVVLTIGLQKLACAVKFGHVLLATELPSWHGPRSRVHLPHKKTCYTHPFAELAPEQCVVNTEFTDVLDWLSLTFWTLDMGMTCVPDAPVGWWRSDLRLTNIQGLEFRVEWSLDYAVGLEANICGMTTAFLGFRLAAHGKLQAVM